MKKLIILIICCIGVFGLHAQQIDTISVNIPSMGKDIKNVVILWTQLKLSEKYSTH